MKPSTGDCVARPCTIVEEAVDGSLRGLMLCCIGTENKIRRDGLMLALSCGVTKEDDSTWNACAVICWHKEKMCLSWKVP
ncbi:hypothetical protein NDU88_002950 [Pleurodeles waltl]|uniref:Uncharacterized protein n=1 Tax=Pleurodeles waltl TaxID=8319 RepID=A0AAV7RH23_PLEWA|nr:hypothetical protein NDU88_002950 [Pleurodeles waltl]